MSAPSAFLHALAQALSTITLYTPRHPACRGVEEAAFVRLQELLKEDPNPTFSFLGPVVVFGPVPLHDLQGWPWSKRFDDIGVQRLEFDEGVTRQSFSGFLADIVTRLLGGATGDPSTAPSRRGIRWGSVGLEEQKALPEEEQQIAADFAYGLDEELSATLEVYREVAQGAEIDREQVETIIASLGVAMMGDAQLLMPALQQGSEDEYRAQHCVHTSVLAMTLAESLGLASHDVHAIGGAALLLDIGLTRVPKELLQKPALTAEERAIIQRHPEEGAKMLFGRTGIFDLAAIVAYEHHLRLDGSGYPVLRYPREPHYASKIIMVCDVYDALRSPKPYRPAWAPMEAIAHIEAAAGTRFDAGVARAFASMMRRLESTVTA